MSQASFFRVVLGLALLGSTCVTAQESSKEKWIPLLNGKDLEGWTVKITGHELGDNFRNTFRVEDGILKVSYDQYPKFEGEFGHLFYKEKLSNYRLRVEYRFVGEQCPEAPDWALRNSGVMIHTQSPESMDKDQGFPIGLEIQFLGGDGENERSTANLCTPGTLVVMDGSIMTEHCVNSSSKTYPGDEWVTVEVEVHGYESVRATIDGETVLSFQNPHLESGAQSFLERTDARISEGYIALQAESHPVELRKVELLRLPEAP